MAWLLTGKWTPLGFGLLVWLALPERVVVIDDDFGYLRSIEETWTRKRPWTDEFLVPWAASTSVLACLIFGLTGSMTAAVQGTLVIGAVVAFAALVALLRHSGAPRWVAAGMGCLLLGGPSALFMFLMLTSVSLYWACLWLAGWAALTRRWSVFILALLVGLGARQSTIMWLALPGWVLVEELWRARGRLAALREWRGPLLAIAAGLAGYAALKLGMNETNAQRFFREALTEFSGAGRLAWVGPAVLLGGCGWAAWLMGALEKRPLGTGRFLAALAMGVFGGWLALRAFTLMDAAHKSFADGWALPMLALCGGAGGFGLAAYARRPWLPALMAGLASLLPQWLYVSGFDYFYLETFFWGFIAMAAGGARVEKPATVSPAPAGAGRLLARWAGVVAALALLAWHGRCWVRHKLMQDRVAAYCELYEKALRGGLLEVRQVGMAPFGYCGWRFDRYYTEHVNPAPGGFTQMQEPWDGTTGTGVITHYPNAIKHHRDWFPTFNNNALRNSKEALTVTEIKAPVLWRHTARFELKRVPPPAPRPEQIPMDPALYVDHPYPLNDEEWRRLLAGDRTLGLPPLKKPAAP